MAIWYSVDTPQSSERFMEAWGGFDAPTDELGAMLLEIAREQVIAYAEEEEVAASVFEPATISWATGERIELSRVGDVVTAVVYPRQTAGIRMNTAPEYLPSEFGIAGDGTNFYQAVESGASPSWTFNVVEQGSLTAYLVGTVGTVGPYNPNPATFQWLAEPAEGTGVPSRLVYAQLQQAKTLWNAGRAQPDSEVGTEGYSFVPRPLDKTIKAIIRPKTGVPYVL